MSKNILEKKKLVNFFNKRFGTDLTSAESDIVLRKEIFIHNVASASESADGTKGYAECICTCESVDRSGDVVIASGIDITDFKKINSIYITHDYSKLPIGKCNEMTFKEHSIEARVEFPLTVPFIKDIFERIKTGVLKGVSIGFEVKEMLVKGSRDFSEYIAKNMKGLSAEEIDKIHRIFTKWSMYEFSIVGVPSNQDCYVKELDKANKEMLEVLGEEHICNEYIEGENVQPEENPTANVVQDESETTTTTTTSAETQKPEAEKPAPGQVPTDKPEEHFAVVPNKEPEQDQNYIEGEKQLNETIEVEDDSNLDLDIVLKPYPNFHAARQRDPEDFEKSSFRYMKDRGGDGIDFVVGKLKGKTSMTLQSIRFDSEKYSVTECRAWLKKHGYKSKVEGAKKKEIEIIPYFQVIRTPEEVESYVKKIIQTKVSGRLNINF